MLDALWTLCREYPILTYVCLLSLFAGLGKFIVTQYLLYTQVKTFPRVLFTVTFMCSLSLLALVLFEIVGIGSPELRIRLWHISLLFITADCILLIPNMIIFKMVYLNNCRQNSSACSSRIYLIVALCLNFLYLKFVAEKSQEILEIKKVIEVQVSLFTDLHINVLVEFITHYGTWIMAVMSGYGAVWCPYVYFNSLSTKKDELEAAKKARTADIKFVMECIVRVKYDLIYMSQKEKTLQQQLEGHKSPWSIRNLLFNRNNDSKQEQLYQCQQKIQFLKQELETMDRAHKDNYEEYKRLVDEERKHEISQTLLGKFFKLMSFVLSIYSVSKILLTISNIIMGRKIGNDPITKLLNFCFWITNHENNETYNMYSNYVSFVFMGYLIISSVRSFSINIKNLFDFILRRGVIKKLETDIIVLILSEVYGVYFLSAVVLLQNSLPSIYSVNLKKVIGDIRVLDHYTFIDGLFLICCVLALMLLYISQRNRINNLNGAKKS